MFPSIAVNVFIRQNFLLFLMMWLFLMDLGNESVNDMCLCVVLCVCVCGFPHSPLGAAQCLVDSLSYCCHPPVSLLLQFSARAVFLRKRLPLQSIRNTEVLCHLSAWWCCIMLWLDAGWMSFSQGWGSALRSSCVINLLSLEYKLRSIVSMAHTWGQAAF